MTPEQAKAHIAAENAELASLEAEVARLAATNSGPVLLAIVRGLVEKVCAADGMVFHKHNKIRFYQGVLKMLSQKGIS